MAFNPLPDSRILASQSLTGSPTTPQAGQGQGLKQRYLSSPGAAADPAPSRSSEPLGLAKSVSPCLCPTAPLSLPLLIHFSPSLGLQPPLPLPIPAVTGGTTLALGQSREPDLPPQPLVMVAQYQGSLWPLPGGGHLASIYQTETEASEEKQFDRSRKPAAPGLATCQSTACLGTPPHPPSGNQFLCAPLPSHSWSPGGSQAAPQPACVMGSSSIPGCLLPPDFIREKVREPRAAGQDGWWGMPGPAVKGGVVGDLDQWMWGRFS